jgi:hypothetical protein
VCLSHTLLLLLQLLGANSHISHQVHINCTFKTHTHHPRQPLYVGAYNRQLLLLLLLLLCCFAAGHYLDAEPN